MPQPTISDAITAWAAHYGVNASNEALTALATLVSTAYQKGREDGKPDLILPDGPQGLPESS